MISFIVYGKAEPGGSKRAFNRKGGGRPIVTDANSKAAGWKQEIKVAAKLAYSGLPFHGPLFVTVTFYRQRLKSHFDKNGKLKDKCKDELPITKPDTTKLMRPLEDALTGILWLDDAQICGQLLTKRYGDKPGAHVIVQTYEEYLANE